MELIATKIMRFLFISPIFIQQSTKNQIIVSELKRKAKIKISKYYYKYNPLPITPLPQSEYWIHSIWVLNDLYF